MKGENERLENFIITANMFPPLAYYLHVFRFQNRICIPFKFLSSPPL